MFVYQFCEIAQMVEMNSGGLVQFFGILKKGYEYVISKGREFIEWLVKSVKERYNTIK